MPRSWGRWIKFALLGVILLGLLGRGAQLARAAIAPSNTYFVLGGSIQREIYVAEQLHQHPERQVLISSGSAEPCIRLIFERANAPLDQTWLENCARSTFGNLFYSLPWLKQQQVQNLRLVTSGNHRQRAEPMARLLLAAHGIWMVAEPVAEAGVPGNQESGLKTALDLGRTLLWAIASQVYSPQCDAIIPLEQVDLDAWQRQDYHCEHQGNL